MPPITRYFIKAGLVYFVAALFFALLLASRNHLNLPAYIAAMGPTYLHLFMVGWVTQIIFGVALWFFPRHTKERPRGREWVNYIAFITINIGLVLRLIAEPAHTVSSATWSGALLVISAFCQFIAALAFAYSIWPRVKATGKGK